MQKLQKWYTYMLIAVLNLCFFIVPVVAMDIPVLTRQLSERLEKAIQHNDIRSITYLLDNALISVHSKNKFKVTPLHLAAWYGNVPAIELFLSRNALINSKDDRKSTPLHEAAAQGWFNAVLVLLNNNANIDSKDNGKNTPLHWAAYHGKVEVMKLLLERGADIECKNEYGCTPLHWANSVEAVALLLERGADIQAEDNEGYTVIWHALNKLSFTPDDEEYTPIREQGQKIIDLLVKSKPYHINMSKKPSTLLGTVVMYLLKKSAINSQRNRYNYVDTAQKIANTLHDTRAQDFLSILNISVLPEQKQEAKRYLQYYLERQDPNVTSELAATVVKK